MPWWSLAVTAADVNGDGKLDIITGGWWYQNPGSIGADPWLRHTIGGNLNNIAWVHDIDGDGDPDIFGTDGTAAGGTMSWAQNDGAGNFTIYDNVPFGQNTFFQGVVGAVLTVGAPYQIVIQWNRGEDGLSGVEAFAVPPDPTTEPWTKTILHPASAGEALSSGDFDADGDLDLFQGGSWLRNEGEGTWTRFLVATFPAGQGDPDRNLLADFDNDGDLDALVGFSDFSDPDTPLIWLERPDDPTELWPQHLVVQGVWGGLNLDAADLDFDGDVDIVFGEENGATRVLVYENVDNGSTWIEHVVDRGGPDIDHHDGTQLFDLDGDGDLDIVSIGLDILKLWIFENQSVPAQALLPPTIPVGLVATPVGVTQINLSWTASTDHGGVAGYRVFRDGIELATTSDTSYLDSGLLGQTEYVYTVLAFDSSGNESAKSSPVFGTTLGILLFNYPFEEEQGAQVFDASGNGNDAMLEGGATHHSLGYVGQAIEFDGVASRVNLGSFDPVGEAFTLSLWFNADDFDVADARLFSKATGPQPEDHYLMISTIFTEGVDLRFRLKTTTEGTSTLIGMGAGLTPGVWTHVAATYDGLSMKLYRNGVQVGSVAKTGALLSAPSVPAWIGGNPNGSHFFDGYIDEVRCYSFALTGAQIQELIGSTTHVTLRLSFEGGAGSATPPLLRLSWPRTVLNGFLEESAGSSVGWSKVTAPVTLQDERNFVILPAIHSQRFFRLRNELTELSAPASISP